MKSKPFIFGVIVALAAWLGAAGCSKSQPPKEAPHAAESAPQTPHHEAASEAGEANHHDATGGSAPHAEPAEATPPAGSAAELWSQIAAQQTKLEGVIRAGRLADVHHLAFAIRDLSVAATRKAPSTAAANAVRLGETLDQIKKSAAALDEFGDAGNLGGVKEEYARFQAELAALKTLAGDQ